MTEKRFSEIISTQKVIDNLTGKEYDCLMDTELLNLINELNEDNVRLKKTNQRLFDDLQKTTSLKSLELSEVSILMRENRELKKENKELKDLLKSIADKNGEIWLDNGQIIRLKRELKGVWVND